MAYLKFKPLLPRINFNELVSRSDLDYETLGFFDDDESLFFISRGGRDHFIVTSKRLLIINYKLFVGNRREILSVPYNKIVSISLEIENSDVIFSINTTNVYELEIKISKPISLDDVYNVYSYITNKIS